MHIIDCKAIKENILHGITPMCFNGKRLLILMKEDNAANRSYVKAIERMAKRFDLEVEVRQPNPAYPMDDIHCILRIRPYRTGVLLVGYTRDETKNINHLCNKEMRGKKLMDGGKHPDVVYAVLEVLEELELLEDAPARTVIIGRSRNARSLCSALLLMGHTPTMVHTKTTDMESVLREADLIISFAGSPNLIKSDMVKDGATVISVGCNTLNGKLCGDIDMDSLADRNVTITPTPNGIGPLCTAVMLRELALWEV